MIKRFLFIVFYGLYSISINAMYEPQETYNMSKDYAENIKMINHDAACLSNYFEGVFKTISVRAKPGVIPSEVFFELCPQYDSTFCDGHFKLLYQPATWYLETLIKPYLPILDQSFLNAYHHFRVNQPGDPSFNAWVWFANHFKMSLLKPVEEYKKFLLLMDQQSNGYLL